MENKCNNNEVPNSDSVEDRQSVGYKLCLFILVVIVNVLLIIISVLYYFPVKKNHNQDQMLDRTEIDKTSPEESPEEVEQSSTEEEQAKEQAEVRSKKDVNTEASSVANENRQEAQLPRSTDSFPTGNSDNAMKWQTLQADAQKEAANGNYGKAYQKAVEARQQLSGQKQTTQIQEKIGRIDQFLERCTEHLTPSSSSKNKGNSIR